MSNATMGVLVDVLTRCGYASFMGVVVGSVIEVLSGELELFGRMSDVLMPALIFTRRFLVFGSVLVSVTVTG